MSHTIDRTVWGRVLHMRKTLQKKIENSLFPIFRVNCYTFYELVNIWILNNITKLSKSHWYQQILITFLCCSISYKHDTLYFTCNFNNQSLSTKLQYSGISWTALLGMKTLLNVFPMNYTLEYMFHCLAYEPLVLICHEVASRLLWGKRVLSTNLCIFLKADLCGESWRSSEIFPWCSGIMPWTV